MAEKLYSRFAGHDTSRGGFDAAQISFLLLRNFIVNDKRNSLRLRFGSKKWATTGDVYGLFLYALETGAVKTPVYDIPIRYRLDGVTPYIEKLNWATDVWDAITQGAQTSFGTDGIGSSAQVGDLIALCAGKPAKIVDIAAGSINRLGGPAPTAAAVLTTPSGATLTGYYSYVYTFYDSADGWESSPSPATAVTTITAADITVGSLETSCAREGVDKKRIYRTPGTGETPYQFVVEIALATTSYVDAIADASLGNAAPDDGDHDPPPTESYICCAHEGRIWIATEDSIYYSLPYDGSNLPLEYYSEDRKFSLEQRVTALYPKGTGSLLAFNPPGFGYHEIIGRNDTTFQLRIVNPVQGTNFHHSVSSNGRTFVYWGAAGPVQNSGGVDSPFGMEMKEDIERMINQEYDTEVFLWSEWNPVANQYIFGLGLTDSDGVLWSDAVTAAEVDWEDADTGDAVPWEIA